MLLGYKYESAPVPWVIPIIPDLFSCFVKCFPFFKPIFKPIGIEMLKELFCDLIMNRPQTHNNRLCPSHLKPSPQPINALSILITTFAGVACRKYPVVRDAMEIELACEGPGDCVDFHVWLSQ